MMMILRPQDYQPINGDPASHAGLSGADLLQLETAADHRDALKIVKKIMKHKNLTEASIKAQLDVAGVNWAHAGEETIDLDFLRSD